MGGLSLTKRISTAFRILRGTAAEDWDAYFGRAFGGTKTKAGTRINEGNALSIPALFAALNFLASIIASLPLRVYRHLPAGGRVRAVEHPLYDRLNAKPNESGLTAWQWKYTSTMHKYLWGNWWTAFTRPGFELIPLLPDRTEIDWRQPQVVITKDTNWDPVFFDRRDVLLVPHVSLSGIMGKGIVHYARESLGLIKAQDEFAASFFGNGVRAGAFVTFPGNLDPKARESLEDSFNEKYRGLGEAWKAIFLSGDAKVTESVVDAQKAQALESRLFSVQEISRWTGLPPHLLHDLSRATFSNIEELDLALVMFTLTPIVSQIEQAMDVSFLTEAERRTLYIKFELKGLLRGNIAARTAFYTALLDRGVFHADDVLDLEDMNPQPNGLGKAYLVPLNLTTKESVVAGSLPGLRSPAPRAQLRDVTPPPALLPAASALRRRTTAAYRGKWEAYARQIVAEEIAGLREAPEDLKAFYEAFRARALELAGPLLTAYSISTLPLVQQEIGSDLDVGPRYDEFTRKYREMFAVRHVEASLRQLKDVADAAGLELVLGEWERSRPATVALHEAVRAENAFARQVFELCGVRQIRAVLQTCANPYCRALDGKVIDIDGAFLEVGEFTPDGAEPLKVTGARRHPPFVEGCDCGIEAVR